MTRLAIQGINRLYFGLIKQPRSYIICQKCISLTSKRNKSSTVIETETEPVTSTTETDSFPGLEIRNKFTISSRSSNSQEQSVTSDSQEESEIKDAQLIFNTTWNKLEKEFGEENMKLPREFIFLNGAPAAGKGVQTPHILRARGITNPPIIISSLLEKNEELKEIINSGKLVPDTRVFEELLRAILKAEKVGVLIDGFPRNTIQAELLKLLHLKMKNLRKKFRETFFANEFPRPVFRICVLYISEEISIKRQLSRGQQAKSYNAMIREAFLINELKQERKTDLDMNIGRKRYRIFKEHYDTLLNLAKMFPFHLINASGSLEEVQKIILEELAYQSSMELTQDTFDTVSRIPLSTSIGQHARQDLIARLEIYQFQHEEKLKESVDFISQVIMPMIYLHSVSGTAVIRTTDPRLEQSLFRDMIMDVLSERGFLVFFERRIHEKPTRVDLKTGEIYVESQKWTIIRVTFPKHFIRSIN